VLLVSQNFLVLYAFSIFAYWKTESGIRKWIVTLAAAISCGFLLSGFSWWVAYPLALLAVGYAGHYRAGLETTAQVLRSSADQEEASDSAK